MLSHAKVNELSAIFTGQLTPASKEKQPNKWPCRLNEILIGDYLVIPLTSTKMLRSESHRMNNCCRDYAHQCAEMRYCLFSIRSRSGERLATLGLANDKGYWRFDQCLGPGNSEVIEETAEYFDDDGVLQTECYPTELYYVAHDVVRLMNAAHSH